MWFHLWFHYLEALFMVSLLGGFDCGFITWRHWLVVLIKVALFGGIDKNKDIL